MGWKRSSLCLLLVLFSTFGYLRAKPQDSFNPEVIQINSKVDSCEIDKSSTPKTQKISHNISIVGDDFILDGQSLHIVSGSLHYFRLPSAYWRDRLRKLKAAGLNSVSTYVEWSYHEPEERQYNFEGDRDIVAFIKTAAEVGLHVLLRPGPYICAERDLGGLPYWLLGKYPNIRLRSTDPDFMEESRIWLRKLFEQVKPMLLGNGGPIILVQVENEYGSYGSDKIYMGALRDIIRGHVGTDALLYTTDGSFTSAFVSGSVSDTLTTIDFGPTEENVEKLFRPLRRYMSSGPLMNSEYYPGWLTHWRENFARTDTDRVVRTLKNMLDYKINVNFYMFFGGTNFEFTAGANYDGTYQPDITSYDYDAPLSEAGDPTPKYYAIRDALNIYNFVNSSIELPTPSKKGNYGKVSVSAKLNLMSEKGREVFGKKYQDVSGSNLPTFETLRQRSGFVLYETTIAAKQGLLQIQKPRDLIFVYVDGVYAGIISRMQKLYSLPITASRNESILSLFVENQGRINYGSLLHDKKGILSQVIFDKEPLNGKWTITGFPLEVVEPCHNTDTVESTTPTMFEGHFTLPAGETPLDTFLDPSGWGKGMIWVNGHNLGRYWPPVGPQITLYVPGVWLKPAPEVNLLQILELNKPSKDLSVQFIEYPILNRTGAITEWD